MVSWSGHFPWGYRTPFPPPPLIDRLVAQGLQLRADVKALMAPFDVVARRRPERHFPALTEAAILLSLEKVIASW